MEKIYIVQNRDIWNNTTLIGFFKTLEAATEAVKFENEDFEGIEDLEITEYVSTYGMGFNCEIYSDDDFIEVFGYIVTEDEIKDALKNAK